MNVNMYKQDGVITSGVAYRGIENMEVYDHIELEDLLFLMTNKLVMNPKSECKYLVPVVSYWANKFNLVYTKRDSDTHKPFLFWAYESKLNQHLYLALGALFNQAAQSMGYNNTPLTDAQKLKTMDLLSAILLSSLKNIPETGFDPHAIVRQYVAEEDQLYTATIVGVLEHLCEQYYADEKRTPKEGDDFIIYNELNCFWAALIMIC